MNLKINYEPYDTYDQGRPWISVVIEWPPGGQTRNRFGNFYGSSSYGGSTVVECQVGDIIRYGQKNRRFPKSKKENWGIVTEDGLRSVTEVEAREYWNSIKANVSEVA